MSDSPRYWGGVHVFVNRLLNDGQLWFLGRLRALRQFLLCATVADPAIAGEMELAGIQSRQGLICARGVEATRRSASPQSRVRFPARAPRSCGVNSQHSGLLIRRVRVQLPPAPPFCHQSVIEGGRRRNLPAPSDLELLAVAFARWERSHPAVRKTVPRRCKSGTRVHFQRGCNDNSSMPRPQRGRDGA